MIKLEFRKLILPVLALTVVFGTGLVVMATSQPVSAACCPSATCTGTCFGCRINPPGGTGCYTNAEGCGGCPPPPPACTSTAPAAATLQSPANNAVDVDLPVTFTWTDTTGWGKGCPSNNNVYILYIKPKTDATCVAGAYVSYGAVASTVKTKTVSTNLKWGTTYCWLIQKNNSSAAANSAPFTFTTTPPPTVANISITGANKCGGAAISGRPEETDTNNPITLQMDITDSHNNFAAGINKFDSVRVAVLPVSEQNSNVVPFSALDPVLRNRLGFRAQTLTPGSATFSSIDSTASPYFGTSTSVSDLKNAASTASVLSLNSATNVTQLNNTTLRVTWQLQFEDAFVTAPDNIYVSVVSNTAGGHQVSQDATGSGAAALNYRKAMAWATDLQPPSVSIGQPVAINATTFTLKWSANETLRGNNGVKDLRSYCYVDSGSSSITDQTLGQVIPLGPGPLQFPSPANCLITLANQGTHTYTLPSGSTSSDVSFGLFAEDGACNTSTSGSTLGGASAWIVTAHGDVSAQGGYTNFKIRDIASLSGIVPNLDKDSFLSTYSAISGSSLMVDDFQSKLATYTTNYDNKALVPPQISGATLWFDYLYGLAAGRQAIDQIALPSLSGNLSTAFGTTPDDSIYKYITNDVQVASGTVCDLNAVIFVKGDLTIEPDFTKAKAYEGCVFVVKGNVVIDTGSTKTDPNAPATSPSAYDVVEGAFITDKNFSTTNDQAPAGIKAWTAGKSGGVARGYGAAVAYNGKMYAWGGYTGAAYLNSMDVYDPVANTWTVGKAGGTARDYPSAVLYNNKMYVWGGYNAGALRTMYVYDFVANTWAAGLAGGTARYGHTAVVYNNKMYIFGGTTAAGFSNTMDIYDFAANTWAVGPSAPTGTSYGAAGVVGSKMYVWGGTAGIMQIFDFNTNTWSKGTIAGPTRKYPSGVVYNNKIYFWAGLDPTKPGNKVDIYDAASNSWTYGVSGGTPRSAHFAVVINGRMYGWGGVNTAGAYINSLDQYDFVSALPGDALYIHGTVYAGSLTLARNLGIAQDGVQPSEVFDYDPVYARLFRDIFGIRTFSLRAQ